tara:strand:- start:618 stop:1115 length:498 start_codon:yes stop_codon:yes gene_type:complete
MLIKVNKDSFVESSRIDQYYLDGRTIVFYISSREHKEIYPTDTFAKGVFENIANSFRDATNETMVSKPSDKILSEKRDMFEDFWTKYDKKINKDDAFKKWRKLSIVDMKDAINMVDSYIRSTPDKQYRKNPSTWIYQKGWRNEVIEKLGQIKANYVTPKYTDVSR